MRFARLLATQTILLRLLCAVADGAERLPVYPAAEINLMADRQSVVRADGLIRDGKYLFKSMRYPEAGRFLSDATNLCARIGYKTAFLDAANTTALLLLETGRTNESRELLVRLFRESFTLKKKNLQIISDLLNNISLVEIRQGRPPAEIFRQLKRAARINRDPVKAMIIENNRCLLLIRTGEAKKAASSLRGMILKAERKGYYEPLVLGLLRIAEARLSLKDVKSAEKAFNQALDRAVFWEYKRGLSLALGSMADHYAAQGDAVKALEYARALLAAHLSMNATGLLDADKERIRQLEASSPGQR